MSASPTRSNVTPMETSDSESRKLNFQLVNFGLALIPLVFALITIGFGVVIAYNFGNWSSSFWLGLFAVVALAIIVYAMWWASHPRTKKWPGFAIGIADLVIVVAVIALISAFANSFVWAEFFWGLLDAVLVAIAYAAILLYGWLYGKTRRAPSNR